VSAALPRLDAPTVDGPSRGDDDADSWLGWLAGFALTDPAVAGFAAACEEAEKR
jgi:hypothetical protein